ncbi:hypothetical protein COC42_12445 [Sphingomonas spermidinifaciens]|uniref:Microcin J25-processing protein McjB C-terminal domain-containing protein n=1 Tax=Sphingomonas spermidinifaciens TaxID=1141889 RepID=A0A2A4B2R6_9SPHN|nr:lasso peptide biosynthesis B2 protein [Sphingomonas spermidinifaciens]PCD02255.1 hypothetical protein COC42_12445 [Sphingomonas spermidinifaciens]
MSLFWRLMPHTTACVASERVILLDIRQDRYFQVPNEATDAFRQWLNCSYAARPPEAVLSTLGRAKILRDLDPEPTNAFRERIILPEPKGGANRQVAPIEQPLRVGTTIALTWLKLRCLPFRSIFGARLVRPPLQLYDAAADQFETVEQFLRSRNLIPIARNCLLDSLALDSWLARRGYGSRFIFGVSLAPFAAHCWLQTRDAILNDSYDHVSRFTPILAL